MSGPALEELGADGRREDAAEPEVGEAELPCTVAWLLRKAVVSSRVVLGGLVVRFVAGELGVTVTPRVDGTRLGVGTWEVREVDWEVVDRDNGVEEASVLVVVRAVLLEAGMCDGEGDPGTWGVVDADPGGEIVVSGGEREVVWGVDTPEGKGGVDRGAVLEMMGSAEEEEVGAGEVSGEGGTGCLVEVDVWGDPSEGDGAGGLTVAGAEGEDWLGEAVEGCGS